MWPDRKHLGAVLIFATLAVHGVSAEVRIRLHESASAEGASILLGDVGEILGAQPDRKQALSAVPLGFSPSGDAERILNQAQIRRALEKSGLDLTGIEIDGAAEVRVKAVFKLLDPHLVALAIQERLATNYPEDLFKLNALTITMNAPVQVPAGEITLVPVMGVASGQPSGTMAIDLYAEKQRLRRFQVQVDWEWEARVPAAARDLPSGKILSESDCRWSQQKRKDIPAGLVLKANELLGMRLLRSLSEGELITQGVLAAPRLVEKGDIVQLALRGKGFNILTTAAAQQAGVAGESIKLMHPDSKKVFIGRVVGKNRVEIPF